MSLQKTKQVYYGLQQSKAQKRQQMHRKLQDCTIQAKCYQRHGLYKYSAIPFFLSNMRQLLQSYQFCYSQLRKSIEITNGLIGTSKDCKDIQNKSKPSKQMEQTIAQCEKLEEAFSLLVKHLQRKVIKLNRASQEIRELRQYRVRRIEAQLDAFWK